MLGKIGTLSESDEINRFNCNNIISGTGLEVAMLTTTRLATLY